MPLSGATANTFTLTQGSCRCGEPLGIVEHVVFECQLYNHVYIDYDPAQTSTVFLRFCMTRTSSQVVFRPRPLDSSILASGASCREGSVDIPSFMLTSLLLSYAFLLRRDSLDSLVIPTLYQA